MYRLEIDVMLLGVLSFGIVRDVYTVVAYFLGYVVEYERLDFVV